MYGRVIRLAAVLLLSGLVFAGQHGGYSSMPGLHAVIHQVADGGDPPLPPKI